MSTQGRRISSLGKKSELQKILAQTHTFGDFDSFAGSVCDIDWVMMLQLRERGRNLTSSATVLDQIAPLRRVYIVTLQSVLVPKCRWGIVPMYQPS